LLSCLAAALEVFTNQIPDNSTSEQVEQRALVFPVTAQVFEDAAAEKELKLQKEQAKAAAATSRRGKGGRGSSRRKGQRGKRQRKRTRTPMAEARILDANVDLNAQAEGAAITPFATAYVASGSTTGSSTCESFGDSSTDNTSQLPELAISQAYLPYTEQPAFSTFAFPVTELPNVRRPAPPPVPAIQMEFLPALPVYQFVGDAPPSLGLTTFGVLTPTDPAVLGHEVFSFCNVPDMIAPPSTRGSGGGFFEALHSSEQRAEAPDAEPFLWDTLSPTTMLALLPLAEEQVAVGAVADQAVPMPPASPASPVVQAVPSVAARALNPPATPPAASRRPTTRSADVARRPAPSSVRHAETAKTTTVAATASAAASASQMAAPVRIPRYAMRSKYRCGYCGQPKLGHECQAMLQVSGTGTQTDLAITAPHRSVALLTVKTEKSADEATLSSESDNSNTEPETEAETSDTVSDAPAPGEDAAAQKRELSKRAASGIEECIRTRSKRRKQAF
jgi:hypothetical protein